MISTTKKERLVGEISWLNNIKTKGGVIHEEHLRDLETNLKLANLKAMKQRIIKKTTRYDEMMKLDWQKQDVVIAKENKISPSLVSYWRNKLKQPKPPNFRRQMFRAEGFARDKYKTLDWTKNNSQLSRENHLSRERIRQLRHELKMPQAINHRKSTISSAKSDVQRRKGIATETVTVP